MFQAQLTANLSYGPHERQSLDVCVPRDCEEAPLVICLHSGWFQLGRREQLRPILFELASAGFACASIGYRLCSEGASAKDILEDTLNGIAKAREEAELLGAGKQAPYLLGSGVGGILAFVSACRDANLATGVITCGTPPQISAWDGANDAIKKAMQAFAQGDTSLSPLEQDCSQLPPVLILQGDSDPEVPAKLARSLHGRCIDHGAESTFAVLNGTKHRFLEDSNSRASQSAIKHICDWIQQHDTQAQLQCGEPRFSNS